MSLGHRAQTAEIGTRTLLPGKLKLFTHHTEIDELVSKTWIKGQGGTELGFTCSRSESFTHLTIQQDELLFMDCLLSQVAESGLSS